MDWADILGLGLWAALITAGSNFLSNWFFTSRQTDRLANYYATRISIELDRYAFSCARLISDDSNFYASEGNAGAPLTELPGLALDVDTDWKTLDIKFVHRVLSFQNDIVRAQAAIAGEADHLTPVDDALEPTAQAGLMGYRAFQLAIDMRSRYKLSVDDGQVYPWDYVAMLKEKHDAKTAEYNEYRKS